MTNALNFLIAHWAVILVVFTTVHTAVSTILTSMNKTAADTKFEAVWHYVAIALGFGSNFVAGKKPVK